MIKLYFFIFFTEKSSLNEALEVEELLDLIKDKKSPWFEMIEWTNDGDHIRQTYIKQQSKFQKYEIENFFTSLRLTDLQVSFSFDYIKFIHVFLYIQFNLYNL